MQRQQSVFPLESLPKDLIIKIITLLFDTQDQTIQTNIANLSSIRMINFSIEASHSKVKIVDFIDTYLWLRLLISIGIFDNQSHPEWGDTIKEYLGRIVRERRYTSRVHDLIDISKSSQSIRDYARILLHNLITEYSDEVERSFLLGEMTDIPSLDNITIVQLINTKSFGNIKYWDVRKVTNMNYLFDCLQTNIKDLNLTYWDTSNVTSMIALMRYVFFDISGITNWNTCRVTDMDHCFYHAIAFNQPLEWNTSNVQNMFAMFDHATSFNQPLHWDTSNVKNMSYMFCRATSFNQPLQLQTKNVIYMKKMFYKANSFRQLLDWNTHNVIDMTNIFTGSQGNWV